MIGRGDHAIRCDVCGYSNGGTYNLHCACAPRRSPIGTAYDDRDQSARDSDALAAEVEQLRAERNRMWPVWKLRYVIRHKLGMLLRDYPDDKETKQIIAEIEGAIWLEEK